MRPEEVSSSGGGGGERGWEEAGGAQADAAAARAQADHRLVRRHGCAAAPVENRQPSRRCESAHESGWNRSFW